MKKQHLAGSMLMASIAVGLMCGAAVADVINVTNWTEALAATPVAGDTVSFAAGNYNVTEPLSVVDGVTYRGAGAGATILDGGGASRAFTAWGDRGATDGVDGGVNDTGQKGWVIEDLTITNGKSDALNKQDILSVARDLLNNFTTADTNTGITPPGDGNNLLNQTEAEAENGALVDNPTWFPLLAGADNQISTAELDAYLTGNPPGSAGHLIVNGDQDDDGGAVNVDNGAEGTIRGVEFLANATFNQGGAIAVNGQLTVLTIDGCLFDGNTVTDPANDDGACIRQEGGSTTTQQGSTVNLLNSIIRNHTCDQGSGYQSGAAYSTTIIKNCLFENNVGDGNGGLMLINNDQQKQIEISGCVIRNNSMPAAGADLLHIRGGHGATVANCTFIGNSTWASGQTLLANRQGNNDFNGDGNNDENDFTILTIANNIFLNNVVQNNVHRGNRTGGGGTPPNRTQGFLRMINNIYFNNTTTAGAAAGIFAATTHLENGADVGTITSDPNIDLTTWIPNSGSPAIDGADATYAPPQDYRGWDRVGVPDIGALEFGAEAPPPPPEPVTVITANVYPPFVAEGMLIVLTAPEGSGYQWRKNDVDVPGATNRTLVFDPVTEEDAGTYTVEYDDGTKVVMVSDPFILSVLPAGSVPAAGILGLIALAGACGLGGARLVRRRN